MVTISLCMIVKNEEDNIEKCLSSVKDIMDEIIIVDTGSTDRTKEIAGKFTDKIYDFEWIDDFSAVRNYAFEWATMDYIMWLDADDIMLPKDAAKLDRLKKAMTNNMDVVMMKYNTGFDLHGNVNFSYFRERLAKRSRGFKWKEPVHEYLEVGGKIVNADICITHTKKHMEKNTRNLEIYENQLKNGITLSPRGMYYFARELKDNGRNRDAILWFNRFLDSGRGWIEDKINACGELAKCYQSENQLDEALLSMLRSFSYDTPRAEICCQIGYYFKEQNNYRQAVYWFELALSLEKPKNNWGFIQHDCWGFIPSIECAVCYDHLGEHEKAARFNDKAGEYKPDSPAVLYNKKYFNSNS